MKRFLEIIGWLVVAYFAMWIIVPVGYFFLLSFLAA